MSARTLTPAECRFLLGSKKVGRVVFTDRALPSALPVNYRLTKDGIVFRTDPSGRLARLLDGVGNAVLGFEVDDVDETVESGWSVLVVGLAVRLPEQDVRQLENDGLRAWGAEDASAFIRIPVDRVSGRSVGLLSVAEAAHRPSTIAAHEPVA